MLCNVHKTVATRRYAENDPAVICGRDITSLQWQLNVYRPATDLVRAGYGIEVCRIQVSWLHEAFAPGFSYPHRPTLHHTI